MPKQPMDHQKSKRAPITKTVRLISDLDLAEELEQAQEDVRRLRIMTQGTGGETSAAQLPAAEARLAELRERAQEFVTVYKFQSIGSKRYDRLVSEHPPTEEQIKQFGDEVAWNSETFPAALIAASMVSPVMTAEDLQVLIDEDLNSAELLTIFDAALTVNTMRRIYELGNV
jgi:hypothetical protein